MVLTVRTRKHNIVGMKWILIANACFYMMRINWTNKFFSFFRWHFHMFNRCTTARTLSKQKWRDNVIIFTFLWWVMCRWNSSLTIFSPNYLWTFAKHRMNNKFLIDWISSCAMFFCKIFSASGEGNGTIRNDLDCDLTATTNRMLRNTNIYQNLILFLFSCVDVNIHSLFRIPQRHPSSW